MAISGHLRYTWGPKYMTVSYLYDYVKEQVLLLLIKDDQDDKYTILEWNMFSL